MVIKSGRVYNNLMHITDLLPTVLEAVGIDINEIDTREDDIYYTNSGNINNINTNNINNINNDEKRYYYFDGKSHWKQFIYSIHGLDNNIIKETSPRDSVYYGKGFVSRRSAIRVNDLKLIAWNSYIATREHVMNNITDNSNMDYFATWNQRADRHPKYLLPKQFDGYIDPKTMIGYELFDVVKDISETNDISLENIEKTKEMIDILNKMEKTQVPPPPWHPCDPLPPQPHNGLGPWCK